MEEQQGRGKIETNCCSWGLWRPSLAPCRQPVQWGIKARQSPPFGDMAHRRM